MTAGTEFSRTDTSAALPRWLTLVLAGVGTLIAIGVLWSLAPAASCGGGVVGIYSDGILPGPQPCGDGGTTPALVTAGILLALLAAVFVVAFTVIRNRGRVLLILGGTMLLVLVIGLLATVFAANAAPPVIYY
jgi:hypothetical protein